jgi:signal transduction histidine kinase
MMPTTSESRGDPAGDPLKTAGRRPSVLVVDDDDDLAGNVAEIVAGGLHVDVEVAGSVSAAMARADQRTFDLVLSDVGLPDGDGTDLIGRLRDRSPLTEVVVITGDATVTSAIAAVRAGAFSYAVKPVAPAELLEIARRALAQVAMAHERERLRAELELSERRHRQVVEAVPALVLALDDQGRIALWNRRLEELSGRSREEMAGQPGETLVGNGGVRPLVIKDGAERLVRWETATVSAGAGAAQEIWTYAVGTDVTSEQEMSRRVLRAERLAAVGTLAAGLAHEVRNPLNSAALQLQVLRRRLAREDATKETLDSVVTLVEDEIRRLERLVSDFLSFARPRPLEPRRTLLQDLCREVLASVAPEAKAAGVALTLEADETLPALAVDAARMRQVLQNLVRNSLEAMSDGGRLTVRAHRQAKDVDVDVADTGPGFPEETPVFDAFFTSKATGTGLGLSIVHRIVSDHGGTVRVRSRPGDTCFTVSLPA